MNIKPKATVDDLYRVPENGKAEIVNGELVLMSPTGGVRVYCASDPLHPTVYQSDEMAEAEPALPGWTLALEEIFGDC
ncbi:MAG TPA: hypothetical protein VI306_19505 [Pyrinomonadaceae bacterium]